MAALTWRNIDAPDFRTALEGFAQSSQMLDRAFNTVGGALTQADNSISERVNQQLLLEAAALQDPNAAKLLSASMAQRPDARRINAQTMGAVTGSVNRLLDTQRTELGIEDLKADMKFEGESRERTKGDWASSDKVAMLLGEAAKAGIKDPAGIQAFVAANAEAVGGLRSQDVVKLNEALRGEVLFPLDVESKQLGIAGAKLNNTAQSNENSLFPERRRALVTSNDMAELNLKEGRWSFNNKQVEYADQRAGEDLATQVGGMANDANTARTLLYGSNVSPAARAVALRILSGQFQGLVGDAPSLGAAPAANGQGQGADTILGYGAYGSPAKPLSQGTIGEAVEFGRNVLIPNSKAAGIGRDERGLLGSSAMGLYQFTQETLAGKNGKPGLAEQVLGKNWRNVQFTEEVQDKLGERLYNQTKNGDLSKTWEGLKRVKGGSTPGAFANMPWSEAKKIIARAEGTARAGTAGDPRSGPLEPGNNLGQRDNVNGAINLVAQASNRFPRNVIGPAWFALMKDGRNDQAAITQLRSGPLQNVPEKFIREQLATIREQTGGNAAQAGAILVRSLTDKRVLNRTTRLGNGQNFDPILRDRLISEVRAGNNRTPDGRPGWVKTAQESERKQAAVGDYQAAFEGFKAAEQALVRARSSPDIRDRTKLPALTLQYQQAKAQWDRAQATQRGFAGNNVNSPGPAVQPEGLFGDFFKDKPRGPANNDFQGLFRLRRTQ